MGRYVPPEFEGTVSANKLAGKHALGNRAKKSGQGILTVRFEMPFAIWCTTCPKPTIIGQGVRFNAEKKKVGSYYSSPIFSFRMKHTACGGWIEIRTDPKNTAYVVVEGAQKRDVGGDRVQEGQMVLRSEEEKQRLRDDAFAALEVTIEDRTQATVDKTRISDLYEATERGWSDPYEASRKLRKTFRVDRKEREKNATVTEKLKDRMSLGIELLEETDADRLRASFVEFGETTDSTGNTSVSKAAATGLFEKTSSRSSAGKSAKKSKSKATQHNSAELVKALRQNTRAATDPFLQRMPTSKEPRLPRIKRKRPESENSVREPETSPGLDDGAFQLVDYDSE